MFHAAVLQRMALKCIKSEDARAELLFFHRKIFCLPRPSPRCRRRLVKREFKKRRRRHREQRRLKSSSLFLTVQTISKLNIEHSVKLEIEIGKISAQPHTIVKRICFPNGNVLFLSLFSLSKN